MSSIEKKNKVFVSCGEMSGDLHLSYIVKEMLKKDKNLEIHGIVGDRSIQAGAKIKCFVFFAFIYKKI